MPYGKTNLDKSRLHGSMLGGMGCVSVTQYKLWFGGLIPSPVLVRYHNTAGYD